jgi:2-C-methyl-D-erythritol 4-phosphate cytidylyltransferase
MSIYCTAIVAAGGSGERMRSRTPKVFMNISGVPIIFHTLSLLSGIPEIKDMVIALHPKLIPSFQKRLKQAHARYRLAAVVGGGKTRPASVANALRALPEQCNVVCIHDAVRPNAKPDLISKAIRRAHRSGAAILAAPVKDTVKRVAKDGHIRGTVDRRQLYLAQTPQVFRKEILLKAYRKRKDLRKAPTDDAELVEALGEKVYIIPSDYDNIKVTTPHDLFLLEGKLGG